MKVKTTKKPRKIKRNSKPSRGLGYFVIAVLMGLMYLVGWKRGKRWW